MATSDTESIAPLATASLGYGRRRAGDLLDAVDSLRYRRLARQTDAFGSSHESSSLIEGRRSSKLGELCAYSLMELGSSATRPSGLASRFVALRIGWREKDLQRQTKSAGGWWYAGRKVWMLRRDVVERLGLLHRVVGGGT